jgi:hypothetical protein
VAAASFPTESVMVTTYRPATALETVNEPAVCPVVPEVPHPVIEKPAEGVTVSVQLVALEAKPVPVTVTTVPVVPVVGDTVTCGTTMKYAQTPRGMSLPGVPFTVTFQVMSEVAVDPTTKLPVATPALSLHV